MFESTEHLFFLLPLGIKGLWKIGNAIKKDVKKQQTKAQTQNICEH